MTPNESLHYQIDPSILVDRLHQIASANQLDDVRHLVTHIFDLLRQPDSILYTHNTTSTQTEIRRTYLNNALTQIEESRTIERARYYTERLIRAMTEERTSPINDINLNRWQEYEDIYTDSLWYEPRRDSSGVHTAGYWGNFIPQIPHQMMRRYTRQGEWVLDTFAGSGTTCIEGQRLGRHTIGIELQADIATQARQRVQAEPNVHDITWDIVQADSTTADYHDILHRYGCRSVQLVMMHPPYFDIIKFSSDTRDLSNMASLDDFLAKMGNIVDRIAPVLDNGRYAVLVIGDKYAEGEWIPLGFYTMQEVLKRGFILKSIIVKNFEETTGKRQQKELWRYRALAGGFYIFKHEYIFIFQKQA